MDFILPGGTTKLDAVLQGKHTPGLKKLMHELRVMKTGEEAAIMRKAGKMSGRAFTKAMGEDFVDEKELANFLDYNFKKNGCDGSAYVPVVGGGVVRRSFPFISSTWPDNYRTPCRFITPTTTNSLTTAKWFLSMLVATTEDT